MSFFQRRRITVRRGINSLFTLRAQDGEDARGWAFVVGLSKKHHAIQGLTPIRALSLASAPGHRHAGGFILIVQVLQEFPVVCPLPGDQY